MGDGRGGGFGGGVKREGRRGLGGLTKHIRRGARR